MEKLPHHTDWALVLMILVALQFVYLRLVFPRRFDALRNSVTNLRPLLSFYRPGRTHLDLFILLRNLGFLGTAPLSLLLFFRLSKGETLMASDWKLYLLLVAGMVFIMQMQRLSLLGAGWIFQSLDAVHEQLFAKSFILRWSALILLPLNLLTVFGPLNGFFMGYLLVIVLIACYLWAVFRSLNIKSLNAPLHLGYLFYYICALEILPWLVAFNHWDDLRGWSAWTI